MKYFKSMIFIIVTSLLLYIPVAFATIFTEDPCSTLTGIWKGEWSRRDWGVICHWDIIIEAATYNENVQLIVKFSNLSGQCYSASSTTITGTCRDGKLDLVEHTFGHGMTGRVFGGMLTFEDGNRFRYAYAHKQA